MTTTETIKTVAEWRRLPWLVRLGVFCEWTGLPPDKVCELCRAGEIKAVQIGKQRRYPKSEIARLTSMAV